MRTRYRIGVFDVFNSILLILMSLSFVYPLIMILATSISEAKQLGSKPIGILPYGLSLESYKILLSDGRIIRYYLNTILYASTGTFLMLASTSMMAYPLIYKDFRGGKIVTVLLAITMFFSGGLVPYYIVMLKLGLIDRIWSLVLPPAISAWNVFLFRSFFATLPESLRESAHIDGAGHFRVLLMIIIPLSMPVIATFALFSIVAYWNDFFYPLIFLRNSDKYPVQLFLRRILVLLDYRDIQNDMLLRIFQNVNSRTVKGAAVIITITPILCIYPFLQKYFTKGILVGAIKS